MVTDSFSDMFKLPGDEEIVRWEQQYREMGEAIEELQGKRAYLERLIAVARGKTLPADIAAPAKGNGTLKVGTWMHAIAEIVMRHPEGISYDDIRANLPGTFGLSVKKNPRLKAFYGALRRLEVGEVIARHHNHAFTPAGFKRYMDKLERGDVEPVSGYDPRNSPMADAVLAYLATHGPSKAATVRDHLARQPEFHTSTRNPSAIFNILKRLVLRGEVIHDEEASTYEALKKIEAPNGKPAEASKVGKVTAFPRDNQPTLRLIG